MGMWVVALQLFADTWLCEQTLLWPQGHAEQTLLWPRATPNMAASHDTFGR